MNELARAEEYLDQSLMIARERTTLFVPELAIQLARVRQRLGHPAGEVRTLAELALTQARDDGNLHQELCALELWLTLVDPEDTALARISGGCSARSATAMPRCW